MKRAAGFVLTAALIGCGAQTTTQGPAANDPPTVSTDSRPMGTVGINRVFSQGVTNVKVVLKTVVPTQVPVTVFDPEMGSSSTVPCTSAGSECQAFAGALCGAAGLCVTNGTKKAIVYVMNAANPSLTGFTFPVPCDGVTYSAEVYAAIASGSTLQLTDMKQAPSVVVGTDCATVTTQPTWADVPRPSLSVPSSVYAGLPAPNDKYTVGVSGDAYPFSSSFTMTATQGANPAVNGTVSGTSAVFAAPATTDVVDLTGTFRLDDSILFASEAKTPWQWQATAHVTPIGTLQVGAP